MSHDAEANEIEQLRRAVRQLREENALLRKAAETFGALADRLNMALQVERRSACRGGGNGPPDRREQAAR